MRYAEAILSLYFELGGGAMLGLGTGVIVASYGAQAIALTARHNADYLNRKAAERSNFRELIRAREANPSFTSYVTKMLGERQVEGASDVAELPTLVMPTDNKFDLAIAGVQRRAATGRALQHHLPLKLLPPEAGEMVIVAGYSGHEPISTAIVDGKTHTRFRVRASCFNGRVVAKENEVGCITPGPVFELDAAFPSGLSGSPVICIRDGDAFVCGIVSSSDESTGRGSAAAIWPILAMSVPSKPLEDGTPQRTTVLDLVHRKSIDAFGPEVGLFDLKQNEDGTFDLAGRGF